jgi:hypothetical protein
MPKSDAHESIRIARLLEYEPEGREFESLRSLNADFWRERPRCMVFTLV